MNLSDQIRLYEKAAMKVFLKQMNLSMPGYFITEHEFERRDNMPRTGYIENHRDGTMNWDDVQKTEKSLELNRDLQSDINALDAQITKERSEKGAK